MPTHMPHRTVRCGVGAPRSGVHEPPPAHEVARFYLAPNSADDSATLNTLSAASNAPVCDGCIAAGLVGIANAMLALLRGSANDIRNWISDRKGYFFGLTLTRAVRLIWTTLSLMLNSIKSRSKPSSWVAFKLMRILTLAPRVTKG